MIDYFIYQLSFIESRYFSRLKWAEDREQLRQQYQDIFCRHV